MYKLELIDLKDIIETEEHLHDRVIWLKGKIIEERVWRIPLILERNTLAIMDGHHRFNVAKLIGLSRVPAILLDYEQDYVILTSWRGDVYIDKNVVFDFIYKRKLFPHKTTRHIITPNPEELEIPLSFLY
jgi:hypothetical protein